MDHQLGDTEARLSQLADSLDCLTEPDLLLLTDATAATLENWRKRGKGPAYVLIGNRYLYPRKAVAEFVQDNVRERRPAAGKDLL